jgi:hypothetical protein
MRDLWIEAMVRPETSIVSPTQLKPRRLGLFFESYEKPPPLGAQAVAEEVTGLIDHARRGTSCGTARHLLSDEQGGGREHDPADEHD